MPRDLESLLLPVVGLGAALALGVVVLYWIRRQYHRSQQRSAGLQRDALSAFREMHERGQITPAEYRLIRSTLAEGAKDEPDHAEGAGSNGRQDGASRDGRNNSGARR